MAGKGCLINFIIHRGCVIIKHPKGFDTWLCKYSVYIAQGEKEHIFLQDVIKLIVFIKIINSFIFIFLFIFFFLSSSDHFASLTDERKTHVLVSTDLLKFNKVAGSDIEIFGKALQLKQADIDGIRMVNPLSVPTQVHQIIQMWKNKNGKLATLGRFTKNLMDAEAAGARIYWDEFYKGVKEVTSSKS